MPSEGQPPTSAGGDGCTLPSNWRSDESIDWDQGSHIRLGPQDWDPTKIREELQTATPQHLQSDVPKSNCN